MIMSACECETMIVGVQVEKASTENVMSEGMSKSNRYNIYQCISQRPPA